MALLAKLFDAKRHYVARFEKSRRRFHAEADTRRCAGDDDVSRLHDEELRAIPDKVLAAEDHRLGISALTPFAVDVEPHVQILRVLDLILGDEPWPDRAEGLAAFALVPLAAAALDLKYALGDIVAEEVARDCVLRLVLCQIPRAFADDDAEFDLVVEFA